jgi:para-nitrobenzyl esterase
MARRGSTSGRLTGPAGALAALLATSAAAQPLPPQPPAARVETGALQGVQAAGVVRFLGVPYAKPPVGPLRWRPPEAAQPWPGVRPADHVGALCMQKIKRSDNGVGPGEASEDCLTLNVFAPTGARGLPVMVWIHGGGLVNGSGTADLYDGSALARQGVVVVTINYRLGRFGFFAHPALTAEAGAEPVANYGLMDQVAALQWVRRNIAAFGGDPARVTLFGESAGGASVDRLMMMAPARGLFARAISESGVGGERSQTLKAAEADGVAFARTLGVSGDSAAALRAIPADAIVAAGDLSMSKGEAPILDGRLLTEDPLPAFEAGHEAQVPYITGSNGLEIPKAWAAGFKDVAHYPPEMQARLEAAFGSAQTYDARILTDTVFAAPARALARLHAANGAPTYLYRFEVASPAELRTYGGAIHASDRQYVFQTLGASPWPTDANDAAQAKTVSAYWTQFARTGDPNGPGRPAWPAYGGSDQLMRFTNAGPRAEPTPDAKILDLVSADQAAQPAR